MSFSIIRTVYHTRIFSWPVLLCLVATIVALAPASKVAADNSFCLDPGQSIVYHHNWEDGWGGWSTSNGLWEVGEPTAGPSGAQEHMSCAGTNLDGNYPATSYSRLTSPLIQLPASPEDGMLFLRFWQWFSFYHGDDDKGYIEISADSGQTWVQLERTLYTYGGDWSPCMADISDYAGQNVRFGFHFVDHAPYGHRESYGWYVDEVWVIEGNWDWLSPESFEATIPGEYWHRGPCWRGWYADRGSWEIGVPSYGLNAPHNGSYCVGTRLGSNYQLTTDTRLVSPPVTLPSSPTDGSIWLTFWYWFSFYTGDNDRGFVEIRTQGGSWVTLTEEFKATSAVWVLGMCDVGTYAGETVQFGFRFVDHAPYGHGESQGFFIDEVSVVEGSPVFNNPDDFEGGSRGWSTIGGLWHLGTPSAGPPAAYSGDFCWGTNLHGNYTPCSKGSLVSPPVTLPGSPPEPLEFVFFHWFDFHSGDGDYGFVSITSDSGATWTQIGGPYTANSSGWSRVAIPIDGYAGETVRFRFNFIDHCPYGHVERSGWHVDDVSISGMPQGIPATPYLMSSVHNPKPPVLSWIEPSGSYQYISVFAGMDEDFIPDHGKRIALVTPGNTTFSDVADYRPGGEYRYKIAVIDDDGHESIPTAAFTVTAADDPVPGYRPVAILEQNFPNPFNPTTKLRFRLNRTAEVTLRVYDVAGRLVTELVKGELEPADYDIVFDASGLASGVYFCQLQVGELVSSKKMILLK
jgi:hypothetical protein